MPRSLTRRGRNPRGQGEGWMWATGEVGLWPDAGQPEQAGFEEDGIGDEVVGQEGWRDEETRGLVNVLQGIQGDGT